MEIIVNALLEGIRALGIDAVLQPQKTSASRPRIDLYFAGVEPAGVDKDDPSKGNKGWERITFKAEFKSEGTHAMWVAGTIAAARKIVPLIEEPMPLTAEAGKTYKLKALWRRLSPGRFEYPDEEESSMPVRYAESYEITVAYPAKIIGCEPAD